MCNELDLISWQYLKGLRNCDSSETYGLKQSRNCDSSEPYGLKGSRNCDSSEPYGLKGSRNCDNSEPYALKGSRYCNSFKRTLRSKVAYYTKGSPFNELTSQYGNFNFFVGSV